MNEHEEALERIDLSANIGKGDAPCGGCGRHIWNIPLLLDTQESDGECGFWWKVAGNANCVECGEPLHWYHKTAPIPIDMSVLSQQETIER